MKLYYTPGACSLSPHIALCEAGLDFELDKVDLAAKKTGSGRDFHEVTPKGCVPALELDDGQVLTEGAAIVQYVADQRPEAKLAPENGTLERYRLQEWLNYISSELQKTYGPLFGNPSEADKQAVAERLQTRFRLPANALEGRDHLLGEQFTVADGYLFVMLAWSQYMQLGFEKGPVLGDYFGRVAQRPGVQQALQAEGLA